MSQRRASHHNRCLTCRINNYFCVCEHMRPMHNQTKVSLIVHVSELTLTSNSAQFVQKILPETTEFFVRGRMNEVFSADPILAREGRPLFLFPDEDSQELNQDFMTKNPGPYHLIIPDGNWTQAKKVKKREPKFDDVQTVKLPPGLVAEYKLRKAPRPDWVSTYEAAAYALGVLEGKHVQEHMLSFFGKWVEATLAARSGDFSAVMKLILSLTLILKTTFAMGLPSESNRPTYKVSSDFKEYMDKSSRDTRTYQDCLKQVKFTSCEKALCLYSTNMNRGSEYLEVLSLYKIRCDDKQIKSLISSKIGFWSTESIRVGWDSEGPSLPALENFKFFSEKDPRKRMLITKKYNADFSNFRKILFEINSGNFNFSDYKLKSEFANYLKSSSFENRNFLTCRTSAQLDPCEKRICFIASKMNKAFDYYRHKEKAPCGIRSISKLYSDKFDFWLYNDGSHPEDWDSEGMPEHVLKTKKELIK